MNSVFKLSNIFMILLGNAAMALGIVMFILPNGLMTGGTTGLSLIVGHYTSLPISAFVFLFNAVMFILGLVVLGRAFAMTTLLSTFFYPVALEFSSAFRLSRKGSPATGSCPVSLAGCSSDLPWAS